VQIPKISKQRFNPGYFKCKAEHPNIPDAWGNLNFYCFDSNECRFVYKLMMFAKEQANNFKPLFTKTPAFRSIFYLCI
jgi:hypothetical protein